MKTERVVPAKAAIASLLGLVVASGMGKAALTGLYMATAYATIVSGLKSCIGLRAVRPAASQVKMRLLRRKCCCLKCS